MRCDEGAKLIFFNYYLFILELNRIIQKYSESRADNTEPEISGMMYKVRFPVRSELCDFE